MSDSNTEIKDMLTSMGVDTDKPNATVEKVKRKSSKRSKRAKAAEPVTEQEHSMETPAQPSVANNPKENEEPSNYSAVFRANPVFEDDPKHTTDFSFVLSGSPIVVTEEDKTLYLKAVLNDAPLVLDVVVAGSVKIRCRALTTYERDIAAHAVRAYFDRYHGKVSDIFLADYVRQYMMSMQIIAVDNKSIPHLSYTYGEGTREEHINDLCEKGKAITDNYSIPRYKLFVKALEVFENKLARLNTAALKQDFWAPGATD